MPSGGYFWLRQKCAPSGPTCVSRGLMSRPVIWLHQGCVYSNQQLGSLKYAHGELKDPKCLEVISKLKVQELYKEPPYSLDPETSNSQVTPVMTFVSPFVSRWEQLFMPLTQTTGQLLWSTFLDLYLSGWLLIRFRLYISGRNALEEILGSFHPVQSGGTTSVCLSAGEAYFDYLIMMEWPKLLPCQVTLFLLVFNKYFMGGYFEAM